ncbi:MAG: class I SAM-dependent methyltransferase [Bacteroidetes bacterium]|nr:class I SAM-dependent methyltransferase [Bacteroidota bacterium]
MIHISGTSALVLLWGGKDAYKSKLAQKYLQHLDLSSGYELYNECSKIWEPYHEILRNRKFGVFNFVESILSENSDFQVVILAAGIAPLSLDIIEKFPEVNVFDVDIDNMQTKRKLFDEISEDKFANRIQFIESDITDVNLLQNNLTEHGWRKDKRTIVIAEGISYYITEDELWNAFSLFQTKDKSNYLILESRVPAEKVCEERRDIQERVWEYLTSALTLKFVTRYYDEKVKEYADKLNAEVSKKHTMKDIEMLRFGKNEIFTTDDSGWIEVRKLIV